jgi:TolB-like protein/Tfp pilus assembly protein PilF
LLDHEWTKNTKHIHEGFSLWACREASRGQTNPRPGGGKVSPCKLQLLSSKIMHLRGFKRVPSLPLRIDEEQLQQQMERIVCSPIFVRAARCQRFLRYLVAAAVADPLLSPKEYTIAIEVFDRGEEYDPAIDATVRVEAGRLRSRLREYYAAEGAGDSLRIELPKGAYRILFTHREERKPAGEAAAPPALFTGDTPAGGEGPDTSPQAEEEPHPGPAVAPSALTPKWSGTWTAIRRLPVSAWRYSLTLAVAVCLLGWGPWHIVSTRRLTPAIRSIAVLPLRNLSGDPGQDYFAEGTTDELITELAGIPGLRVASWNSVLQEKDTSKPLQTIARELHADVLVEGSVTRSGETVRINTQLIDTRNDNHLWANSFEGRAGNMMALEDRAAREIADHTQAGGEPSPVSRSRLAQTVPVPMAAREAYLRGRKYFDKRQGRASAEEFQRAIDLDPTFADAYAGLAVALESEALLSEDVPGRVIPKALAAAQKSLEIDPQNGDGLIARGSIALQFLWDWEAARRDLTRGVVLNPTNSYGHMMLSLYFDALGKQDEAVQQMQDAVEMDPLSFFMARHYGSSLFFARRYDDARIQLEYAGKMQPDATDVVSSWISAAYEKQGNYKEAMRYSLREVDPHGKRQAGLKPLLAAYHAGDWKAYWTLRLQSARSQPQSNPCSSYNVGMLAIRAGRLDEALASLKEATRRHCYWMIMTRSDPQLDDLRSNPGFHDLLDGLHLPSTATP